VSWLSTGDSLAIDFGLKRVVNKGLSTLSSGLSVDGLACTVADGSSFPSERFWATIEGVGGSGREIVLVSAWVGNLLLLGARAEQGSVEADHPYGSLVRVLLKAGHD
jgi:hypothetical protein